MTLNIKEEFTLSGNITLGELRELLYAADHLEESTKVELMITDKKKQIVIRGDRDEV